MTFRLALGLILISGVASADGTPAPPHGNDDIDLAKAHYKTGEIYYEKGRFPDAAHEFEEAYRLSGRAELLYNMGKSYDGAGDSARAIVAYRRFLGSVKSSPDRATVESRVDQLSKIVGRLSITSTVTGSTVKIDGAEVGATPLASVIEVNPGGHQVEVSKEGYSTWKSTVVAPPGSEVPVAAQPASLVKVVRVEVPAQEKKTPVYKKWWLWTIVGGVVVIAAATTAAVLATRDNGVDGPFAQLPAVKTPTP